MSSVSNVSSVTQVPSEKVRRQERLRRISLSLVLPVGVVPTVLRGYLERCLDAIYDDTHRFYHFYLFPTRDTLEECLALCRTAIRRSAVPVELHAELPLWGGTWCAELEISTGGSGRRERGAWWFPSDLVYQAAKANIQSATQRAGLTPNNGRGAIAIRSESPRCLVHREYLPKHLRFVKSVDGQPLLGRAKRLVRPRPAFAFATPADFGPVLLHCDAVIPMSRFPRKRPFTQEPDLFELAIRTGGFHCTDLVCLSEEIGGVHFERPDDLAEMKACLARFEEEERAHVG